MHAPAGEKVEYLLGLGRDGRGGTVMVWVPVLMSADCNGRRACRNFLIDSPVRAWIVRPTARAANTTVR